MGRLSHCRFGTQGTPDPSPYLYDTTMYTMAGLMGVAALTHTLVTKVDLKFFETPEEAAKETGGGGGH